MEQSSFLFLNTTGASSLSRPAAKRMRAHITKTNFAKRRQRINNSISPESEIEKNTVARENFRQLSINNKHSAANENNLNMILPPVSDAARDPKALHDLQRLVFLEGIRPPVSASEAAWFNLIASDPALIESTMAIAVRLWSPDDCWQMESYQHSCTAINLIKRRIASTMTSTDGVLGAVTTMAFGASLENDDVAWNVHIDGLAQILKERQSRSTTPPPSWLTGLVVHIDRDSVNAIFNFPRVYHERILQILIECSDQSITRIKAICDSVIQLQKKIDSHDHQKFDSNLVAREIEEPLATLHYKVRALRTIDDIYVQATARSIELVLYLLWPSQSGAHLTLLAGELKEAICLFPIQGCSYMNLTSFQLMIGAIAADENSPTRAWFFDRMAREARALRLRGWNEPLSLLQDRNMPAGGLTRQIQALWKELCH
ncbi:uncharacterized protein N7498_007326 [Penicillium cinerascens]|uniref:Uncharacterized protein n=1 Tax=Penicillium cinerascens TaxID=70096 RepID=A0A9W9JJQ1_9EURO|nr:uncharacterized protein N7498_007326 [Penicillium cinerascens]KAJ5198209.1 hypothetical protein N7498_007326 [Penicillium cinerascens]